MAYRASGAYPHALGLGLIIVTAVHVLTMGWPKFVRAQFPEARPSERSLDLFVELGGDDVSDDEVFVRIVGLELSHGEDGELLVFDAGTMNIRRYDMSGTLLQTIGRRGSGPGEFRSAGSLQVGASEIFAWDWRQGRFSRFGADGEHIQTSNPPSLRTATYREVFELRGGYLLAGAGGGMVSWDSVTPTPVVIVGAPFNGDATDTVFSFASGMASWIQETQPLAYGGFPGFWEPAGAWDVLGDSLTVFVDGVSGHFEWYVSDSDGLRLTREYDLHLRPEPITRSDRRRIVEHLRSQLPASQQRRLRSVRIGLPEYWAGVNRALLNPNGETWFRLGTRGGTRPNSDWFILGAEEQLEVLSAPEGVEVMRVRGDFVLAVARTEFESPLVRVYRIR